MTSIVTFVVQDNLFKCYLDIANVIKDLVVETKKNTEIFFSLQNGLSGLGGIRQPLGVSYYC